MRSARWIVVISCLPIAIAALAIYGLQGDETIMTAEQPVPKAEGTASAEGQYHFGSLASLEKTPIASLGEEYGERIAVPQIRQQVDEVSALTPESAYRVKRLEQLERMHTAFVDSSTASSSDQFTSGYLLLMTSVLVDMDTRGDYRETGESEVRTRSSSDDHINMFSGKRYYVVDPARYATFAEMRVAVEGNLNDGTVEDRVARARSALVLTDLQRADIELSYTRALGQLTASNR